MICLSNSGIYSLAGFAYQIKVFIYYLSQLDTGYSIGYETFDDVAISNNNTNNQKLEDGLSTYNGLIKSSSDITALQVKHTKLSKEDFEKVLYNWIIIYNTTSYVKKYILVVDKTYKNENSLFPNDLRSLFDQITSSNKSSTALITQVKDIIKNDYELFTKICHDINSKYDFVEIDDIDTTIYNAYKSLLNHGGVREGTYKLRIKELVEILQYAILNAISAGNPYICNYYEFKQLVEDVCSRISDILFQPDYCNFKKTNTVNLSDETMMQSRHYKQLKKCQLSDFLFKEYLIFEAYYNEYKIKIFSNFKTNTIDNIEDTAHFNFEEAKLDLISHNNDRPCHRLDNTVKKDNDHAPDKQIRYGAAIHLTKAETDKSLLISWEDENE